VREPHETRAGRLAADALPAREPGAAPRLAPHADPSRALQQVGMWLDPRVSGLALRALPSGAAVASWMRTPAAAVAPARLGANVAGDPAWRLEVFGERAVADLVPELERAVLLLAAWRDARAEVERQRAGLAARARELDTLQTLGRRAARAGDAHDLFADVAETLHGAEVLDLAVASYVQDEVRHVRCFLGRPVAEGDLRWVLGRVARFDGRGEHEPPAARRLLSAYDPGCSPRAGLGEQDLIVLPLERRGAVVGCLAVVPSGGEPEAGLRLLFGAANQAALHLDRLLARREAEADRFRAMVEAMPHGVLWTDATGHVLQANAAARRMLGRDAGAQLERLGLWPLVARAIAAGQVRTVEARGPGGIVLDASISPMPGEHGAPPGALLVFADVTESRRLQHELAQSEKMSSLGQMISGVAHELNNPLAAIVGYAQLLRQAVPAEGRGPRQLETLCREAERCKRIVHGLLSFARRHEPERKPFSLNEAIGAVLSLLAYQLRVDGVSVECDLDPALHPVEGDRHQIEQLLVNLITNARQALGQAGRAGTLWLRTRGGPSAIVLEVADDGPGIPAELRTRVFDPFFTTKAPGEGTGLGLALVYRIAADHGGSVELVDGEGPGATFRVTLPAGSSPGAAPAPAPRAAALPGHSGRILVVDDEDPVVRLICEALEAAGHRPLPAAGAAEALERIAAEPFDLIVCDLRMPGLDGLRLVEQAERLRRGQGARVLLTTGDTLRAGESLPEGVDVLAKPFDLDDLLDRVRRRLRAGD